MPLLLKERIRMTSQRQSTIPITRTTTGRIKIETINQNQNRKPQFNDSQMTVVEKAILQSLDSMHNKFDDIARRVTALERKFFEMDAFLEGEFGNHDNNDDERVFESKEDYDNYHPHNWDAPDNNNMTISDDSENYEVPSYVPSKDVNPAKRQANFSSAEDSPEYKVLKAELERVQAFAQTQTAMYRDLKKNFNNLNTELQDTVQQAQNGRAQ